jgi:hypothetical protein
LSLQTPILVFFLFLSLFCHLLHFALFCCAKMNIWLKIEVRISPAP